MTITDDFFKRLVDWQKISGQQHVTQYIIYGGNDYAERRGVALFPWHSIAEMCTKVYGI